MTCHPPPRLLVRIQSAYLPGYNAALASSLRDGPLRNLAPQFTALGRHSRKTNGRVLVIWVRLSLSGIRRWQRAHCDVSLAQGTADKVVPYRYAARVQALLGEETARLVTIEGGGHDVTTARGGEVVRELVGFFRAR